VSTATVSHVAAAEETINSLPTTSGRLGTTIPTTVRVAAVLPPEGVVKAPMAHLLYAHVDAADQLPELHVTELHVYNEDTEYESVVPLGTIPVSIVWHAAKVVAPSL
jgi:hypothetical protein